MDKIINLIISLCVLAIISVLVKNLISGTKSENYVRLIITCVSLTITVNFLLNFDQNNFSGFEIDNFKINNNTVWDDTLEILSDKTEEQMLLLCRQNGLSVNSIDVVLETDYSDFIIKSVTVSGIGAKEAKNLIAGYFQIGLAYINITED